MKPLLLFVIILFSINCYAQSEQVESDLSKVVSEYLALTDFLKQINSKTTEAELDGLDSYYKRAESYLDRVEKDGNADLVKTASYIRTAMLRDIGVIYAWKKIDQQAYKYLKMAEEGMKQYKYADLFPVSFKSGSENYSMSYDDFKKSIPEYYESLGDLCDRLSKPEEAKEWYYTLIEFFHSTEWDKYNAVCGLINCKVKLKEEDGELLNLLLRGAKILAGLDYNQMEQIRKDKRFDYNICYTATKYLLKKHPEFSVDGDTYVEFANNLKKGGEFSKASEFYRKAINNGYSGLDGLKTACSAAIQSNDMDFLELVLYKLDSLLALQEYDDKGVGYWQIGNEFIKSGFPDKSIPYYTKSIIAGFPHIQNIIGILNAAVELNNPELGKMIKDTLRHIIARGYDDINGLSMIMDEAVLLKDRDMESDIIDRLENVLSKMKLAEQCKYASLMELRYFGWGYHEYEQKWLQKIIKCNKKHL